MKNTTTTQLDRLKAYSLMAAGLFAGTCAAEAQIIYTDIDPEAYSDNCSGMIYDVDLNNDGNAEIRLKHYACIYGSILWGSADNIAELEIIGSNVGVVGTFNDAFNGFWFPPAIVGAALPLHDGSAVSSARNFYTTSHLQLGGLYSDYIYGGYSYGLWSGMTDRYIGIQFELSGNVHYGWVRMDIGSGYQSMTVKDYAYEATPGVPIAAGSISCPIPDALESLLITSNQVQLDWEMQVANGYEIIGNEVGQLPIDTIRSITNSKALTYNFNAGTDYYWQVRSVCENDTSGFSDTAYFRFECTPPTFPTSTINSSSEVELEWQHLPAAVEYQLFGGVSGSEVLYTDKTANNSIAISFPFETDTTYAWAVRSICVNDTSELTDSAFFYIDAVAPVITCPINIVIAEETGTGGAVVSYAVPTGNDELTGAETVRIAGIGQQRGYAGRQIISSTEDLTRDVLAADFDNDGDLDVLSSSLGSGAINWFENDGTGLFGPGELIDYGNARSIFTADIDGDGLVDVVGANGALEWFQNLGDHNFGDGITISTDVSLTQDIFGADVDDDNDIDLLTAGGGNISLFENKGNGTFEDRVVISSSAGSGLHTADLDNDGDPDIITAGDDGVSWHENSGIPGFGPAQLISLIPVDAMDVQAIDLDGDGDIDIAAISDSPPELFIHRNIGGGSFGSRETISVESSGLRDLLATDLDADGDADLIITNVIEDEITWFENDGNGLFPQRHLLTDSANGAWEVFAADLDNDGSMDILSASQGDDEIAWYPAMYHGRFFPLGSTTEVYQVRDLAGNSTDCSFTVTVIPGAATERLGPEFNVRPNPATSALIIDLDEGVFDITLRDATGKIVYAVNQTSGAISIALEAFAAGLYFVNVISPEGTSTRRIYIN